MEELQSKSKKNYKIMLGAIAKPLFSIKKAIGNFILSDSFL